MNACNKVQSFLKLQLEKNNIKRVDVSKETGISSYVIHNIFNGGQEDVAFKTILRLADHFNCTADEVLGRKKFQTSENNGYNLVESQDSMEKIRDFIKIKMEEEKLNIYKFAKKCGLGRWAFSGFVNGENKQQSLGSNNILAIVDTFDVSLDELIGRSKPIDISKDITISHDLNTPSNNNKPIPQKYPSDHFKSLEKIQETLEGYVLPNDKTSHTHQTPMPKTPTKHKNNSPLR